MTRPTKEQLAYFHERRAAGDRGDWSRYVVWQLLDEIDALTAERDRARDVVRYAKLYPNTVAAKIEIDGAVQEWDAENASVPVPVYAPMTPEERELQRRSFVYGNVSLSNPDVTRELVDDVADRDAEKGGGG